MNSLPSLSFFCDVFVRFPLPYKFSDRTDRGLGRPLSLVLVVALVADLLPLLSCLTNADSFFFNLVPFERSGPESPFSLFCVSTEEEEEEEGLRQDQMSSFLPSFLPVFCSSFCLSSAFPRPQQKGLFFSSCVFVCVFGVSPLLVSHYFGEISCKIKRGKQTMSVDWGKRGREFALHFALSWREWHKGATTAAAAAGLCV